MRVSSLGRMFVCLAAVSLPAIGQRHGRPDGIQNYTKGNRQPDPLLCIHLRTEKKWLYLHLPELKTMHRIKISTIDPASQKAAVYEGVAVSDLLPASTVRYTVDVYRERPFVLSDKLAFSTELQPHNSSLIVADKRDGRTLKTDDPYVVISNAEGGLSKVSGSLAYIRATAHH